VKSEGGWPSHSHRPHEVVGRFTGRTDDNDLALVHLGELLGRRKTLVRSSPHDAFQLHGGIIARQSANGLTIRKMNSGTDSALPTIRRFQN
jgi:hypothetical protein